MPQWTPFSVLEPARRQARPRIRPDTVTIVCMVVMAGIVEWFSYVAATVIALVAIGWVLRAIAHAYGFGQPRTGRSGRIRP